MATTLISERRLQDEVVEYYANADVRLAIRDYCGGAAYVVGLVPDERPFPTWVSHGRRVSPSGIDWLFAHGCDIARSLWDREHLIFLLELDHQNVDAPADSYLRPADAFFKLEPGYRAMRRVLNTLTIEPRIVMTGRGYQFTGRIRLDDPIVAQLAGLFPEVPAWHAGIKARRSAGVDMILDAQQARAASGLGLLIEYCAHLVMREATPVSPIPVVFNGTIVGDGPVGRECVSIDFSHLGDPLDVRHVRVAFSAYQWHLQRPDIFGPLPERHVGPLVALPRASESFVSMLSGRRTPAAAAGQAWPDRASLPEISDGIARLFHAYIQSPLAAFHRAFYAHDASSVVRDPDSIPPCIRAALAHPNDRLLKPEHLQHAVRGLMARGWSPRAIAALVRSKYEEDHGWGDRWSWMDPQTRADFDVRVFSGMIATGLDSLVDFNCVSAQQKDICPRSGCAYDLRRDRDRLIGLTRA